MKIFFYEKDIFWIMFILVYGIVALFCGEMLQGVFFTAAGVFFWLAYARSNIDSWVNWLID
jgi:hypothetical protein